MVDHQVAHRGKVDGTLAGKGEVAVFYDPVTTCLTHDMGTVVVDCSCLCKTLDAINQHRCEKQNFVDKYHS